MKPLCRSQGHEYATVGGRQTNRCVYCGKRAQLLAGKMQRRSNSKEQ